MGESAGVGLPPPAWGGGKECWPWKILKICVPQGAFWCSFSTQKRFCWRPLYALFKQLQDEFLWKFTQGMLHSAFHSIDTWYIVVSCLACNSIN